MSHVLCFCGAEFHFEGVAGVCDSCGRIATDGSISEDAARAELDASRAEVRKFLDHLAQVSG